MLGVVTQLLRPSLLSPASVARFAAASGTAAFALQPAAFAADASAAAAANALPDDRIVVGIALALLVLTLLLNASLGDVIGDEAQLPSSVNLINKSRQRRSDFIKGKRGE
jgi:hypothetical protein|eukprot:jgi/Chrpa1/27361/Chrysochromulina_OHIO_Genome00003507-RA